jgi:hypothetical protein
MMDRNELISRIADKTAVLNLYERYHEHGGEAFPTIVREDLVKYERVFSDNCDELSGDAFPYVLGGDAEVQKLWKGYESALCTVMTKLAAEIDERDLVRDLEIIEYDLSVLK